MQSWASIPGLEGGCRARLEEPSLQLPVVMLLQMLSLSSRWLFALALSHLPVESSSHARRSMRRVCRLLQEGVIYSEHPFAGAYAYMLITVRQACLQRCYRNLWLTAPQGGR